MTELKDLIAQRRRVKTRITLFEKYLTPLLETKLNKSQSNELSLRLSKFQDLSYNFDELQSKIESLDIEDEGLQMKEREEIENRFFKLIAQAQEMLQIFENALKIESGSVSVSGSDRSKHRGVKLPPLKIPPFNGDQSKWIEFRDMYLSLIHNNDTIEDINKFHYLKSYLEDSASAVINSVTVSSINYSTAWSLLCDRYNNKRLLINEHIKGLFSIEPISRESEQCLRNLIDNITKNLNALNSLGEPTEHWDSLIIYLASSKLDSSTARKWEEFRSTHDNVKLSNFFEFLRQRATVLETVHANKPIKSDKRNQFVKSKSFIAASPSSPSSSSSSSYTNKACLACKLDHKLYNCPKFKSMSVDDRIAKVHEWQICTNCLREGHSHFNCRLGGCRFCKRKHNSILHRQSSLHYIQPPTQTSTSSSSSQSREGTTTSLPTSNIKVPRHNSLPSSSSGPTDMKDPSCVVSMSSVSSNQALLSTALVKVTTNGKSFTLKALLDSGSQSSFITEAARTKIGLPTVKNYLRSVCGLNNSVIKITEHCNIVIHSTYNTFSMPVRCYIIPLITDKLPQVNINIESLQIPNHIHLADPNFFVSSEVDMLLGADVFWDLLCSSRFKLGLHMPTLQETQLGWIVAGPMGGKRSNTSDIYCNFSKEIQQQLSKFWELEEVPAETSSFNEHFCEKLFNETTYRDKDGRFCVQIPFRDSADTLGDSYNIAKRRLIQVEKKLSKNPNLRSEYNKFMKEYEDLGHMSEVTDYDDHGCFLPHHAVIRESSETTKTRVVFDASSKTSNNIALNDIQATSSSNDFVA
ncbi:uncharacterized protein LOC123875840 [Maniola jurtina]|uniref:uncharacterized protein LOC123875840 n=1 Tax=Maniola jurtina TaxID=191418 RepID=UPI001E68F199|nr:uncharacterized protein LOC123875840 [Maniola jurtina]